VRRARGFTLIEVLVALAIVAIGMAAVMGTLTSSADTVSYLRDKTLAQWVGLNQIANLRLSGQMTPTGNSDGDTDYAGRSWHWRQEVTATEVAGVVRIDVKVRPKEVQGGDDNGWFTTVTGIQGDAVGIPNGFQPAWGAQSPLGQTGAGPGLGQPNPAGIGSMPQTGGIGVQGSAPSEGLGSPVTLDNDQPTPPPSTPPLTDPQNPPDNPQ
jgi:general secretion pathway protein I